MGKRVHRDIVIRGVTYESAVDAAGALGVRPDTVRLAIRRGALDRVGTGDKAPTPTPVRIAGKVFPSQKAAARHFGVTQSAISMALNAGDPDRIARPRPYNGAKCKPVTVGGIRFRSRRAASIALGLHPDYVARALARGGRVAQERILAAAMVYLKNAPQSASKVGSAP